MARQDKKQAPAPQESGKGETMRLDKYLKVSRIIKRRSVANDACDTGHVIVNGKDAKPGTSIRVGDVIGVRFGEKLHRYEILSVADHVAKQDASGMYRLLEEE